MNIRRTSNEEVVDERTCSGPVCGNAGTGVRTLPDGGLLSVEDLYEKDMESIGTQSFCRG